MRTIKIVAPSYDQLKACHTDEEIERNCDCMAENYLDLLSSAIVLAGSANALRYTHVNLTTEGLEAEINVSRLPEFNRQAMLLEAYDFEQEMIAQTIKGNKQYGDDCPIATHESLRQPLAVWANTWITIYLWLMMRVAYTIWASKSHERQTTLIDNEKMMQMALSNLANKQPRELPNFSEIATEVVDYRVIDLISERVITETIAAMNEDQNNTTGIGSDKKEAIKSVATQEFLTIIGELLEQVKSNDEYFKDDDYYM